MKLGIFGDSYAEAQKNSRGGNFQYPGWPELLNEMYHPELYENHAKGGTSVWWSYQEFLKHYKKFDHIIFVHSLYHRWPHLPEELVGFHGDLVGNIYTQMKQFKDVYLKLFTQNLTEFICKNVAKDIEKRCIDSNIKLIHIFIDLEEITTKNEHFHFPIIINFGAPSLKELVTIDCKIHTLHNYLMFTGTSDIRTCHMNPDNNKLVANLIKQVYTDNIKKIDFEKSIYVNKPKVNAIVDEIYKNKGR